MSNSESNMEPLKESYSNFQKKMIIRGILFFILFGVAVLSMKNLNMLGSEKFFNVLLFISPFAMVWVTADTILISLLRRRHQQLTFILLYKPCLSENKRRSTIKELAILSWIIGHLLASLLGTTVEFYTLLAFLIGLSGTGRSIFLYMSTKFELEEQLPKIDD